MLLAALLCVTLGVPASAQDAAPPPAPAAPLFSPEQLETLTGPIALYPDPIIAELLAAATLPSQVVIADRDVTAGMSPDNLTAQGLDGSVVGLAHYPNILKWMDDNLAWTTQLGQAFANQQSDVMNAIQNLRARAQSLGNLPDTPQENVVSDEGDIEIEPVNPDVVYVPSYDFSTIYWNPGVFCAFGVGFPLGGWIGFDWDWRRHHVICWDHDHPRPHDWWTRPPGDRDHAVVTIGARAWRPPRNRIIVTGGGDRGYENRPGGIRVEHPNVGHQQVVTIGGGHEARPAEPPHREPRTTEPRPEPRTTEPRPEIAPREVSRPAAPAPRVQRAPESGGMFTGIQSSRATHEFSARGAASESSPAFHGGGAPRGGGGGEVHASGGGGGGGGSHGGGGGRTR